MKLLVVAEAWGRREKQFQHALVGPSGRELTIQMGIAGLAPFMTLTCPNCHERTIFDGQTCKICQHYLAITEFHLIDHWKRMRLEHSIAVTNVFNEQPPDMCALCNSINIQRLGSRARCLDCRSTEIKINDLGWFFGHERETELPSWKASKKTGGSHLKSEHYHHLVRLWAEIKALKPNLIVALGNCPCWAILGQTKISALRGTINWSQDHEVKVLPTYHPAFVLRPTGRSLRPTAIADLTKAAREVQFREVRRPERWITIPSPDEAGLDEIREWFKRPATAYANDIETIRRQISIIGFARSASDALVIPFRDCNTDRGRIVDIGRIAQSIGIEGGGINYWPTASLEFQAWRLAIAGLQSLPRKIFQNGMFDNSHYLMMGIQAANFTDDTMLWHHSEYPEMPKSLGYLGSLYADDIAWKQFSRAESLKRDE